MPLSTEDDAPLPADFSDRHPGTRHLLLQLDTSASILSGEKRELIGEAVQALAYHMVAHLDDGPELTTGLRHLLDAGDCFLRQYREDERDK